MKRTIPVLITAVVGFILAVVSFVPSLMGIKETTEKFFLIIGAFGVILGAASLLYMHGMKVRKTAPGWGYSMIAIIGFFVTLVLGLVKWGVPAPYGIQTVITGDDDKVAWVELSDEVADATREDPETGEPVPGKVIRRKFVVQAYNFEVASTQPIFVEDIQVGEVTIGENGRGDFSVTHDFSMEAGLPSGEAVPFDRIDKEGQPGELDVSAMVGTIVIPPMVTLGDGKKADFQPLKIAIGAGSNGKPLLAGTAGLSSSIAGQYDVKGGAFEYTYEFFVRPLQATMFALLAFYVASAAFRAFRARNTESVILLLTAFIVLLGRTFAGAWMTDWLPETGFWSFFRIPNLTDWIMMVFNTAGSRAIIIGVALGVASMSLKILLGIDRSYLGSDKG